MLAFYTRAQKNHAKIQKIKQICKFICSKSSFLLTFFLFILFNSKCNFCAKLVKMFEEAIFRCFKV